MHNLRQPVDLRPDHPVLVLLPVQDVAEVDAPNNVTVRPHAGHEMPPSVQLEEEAPRHADASAPGAQRGAVDVIHAPQREAAEEDRHAEADEEPHVLQDVAVALVQVCLLFVGFEGVAVPLPDLAVLFFAPSPGRPQNGLHVVHAPEDDEDGQCGVHVLVEGRVLDVVVVRGDEDAE